MAAAPAQLLPAKAARLRQALEHLLHARHSSTCSSTAADDNDDDDASSAVALQLLVGSMGAEPNMGKWETTVPFFNFLINRDDFQCSGGVKRLTTKHAESPTCAPKCGQTIISVIRSWCHFLPCRQPAGRALTRRPFVDRVGNRRVTDDFVSPATSPATLGSVSKVCPNALAGARGGAGGFSCPHTSAHDQGRHPPSTVCQSDV